MSRSKLIISAFSVGLTAFFVWRLYNSFLQVSELSKPDERAWWGPGSARELNRNAVVPFKIDVSNEDLNDLKERLKRFIEKPHRPPLENQGFQYGFNSNYLKQVATYWRNEYDWRKRERYFNQYPQYKTNIFGLDVHFVRATPKPEPGQKVLPLLLLHGWPSSIREFYDVIPHLTEKRSDSRFVFEVVVPSLPGYGFSQAASKPGFGPSEMAALMKNLMDRLKFEKFYVAGGDWGALIGKLMARYYPNRVLGLHSSMCAVSTPLSNLKWILGSVYPPMIVEDRFKHKLYPYFNVVSAVLGEMGYFWIQATKPDTVGTALSDTPAGLAAYILEKFSTWTNREKMNMTDGGLTEKYTLESLLDNVMIYWITNSITTSQRLYYEAFQESSFFIERFPITVPTACARFHRDILWLPETILREIFVNLVHVTDHEKIGHFPALEEPKIYAEDVWSAVKTFEDSSQKSRSSSSSADNIADGGQT